ncbi:ATP-dependent DNA ligase [Crossiella sp. CA-258035]|uniref:ATP-dependent DNA ligase n=1 Tax=Crossiella sp. CA-258035 TaxID=2981138 RepID=UPI0024BC8815|nr:ATP-dependent DNA ligase [Crossiella sp. CA-258035]WHT21569.1 ATP-dependent DNA ligase [Crossiella sp. CA-258035]
MTLPLTPPVQPMLASPVDEVPDRDGLLFEPKWDGFRCVVFRDGDSVFLQSRSGKDLARYFPEAVEFLRAGLPDRVVIDGELVVEVDGELDFDALTERIHPAASRITLLAAQHPARFIAFDLLAHGDETLLELPFTERRARLEKLFEQVSGDRVHLTPATAEIATAREWFTLFEGAGLDGLIAKPADGPYAPGKRTLLKIKHARTADCVLAGLRWHVKTEPGTAVGSLLLGLYDDKGVLHHVGVIGSFPAAKRKALVEELAELREGAEDNHPWLTGETDGQRLPGAINRWRSNEQSWLPLRPERVVEIAYTQTEGGFPARLRHNGLFLRWRPDREPDSCRYDQLDQPAKYDLDSVLGGEVKPA